jgi:hypothetical protein
MSDRIHSYVSIVHAQYGEQKYVSNGHHVFHSEFGEFYQLFFYEVVDLSVRPPRMKTLDLYVTNAQAGELYRALMPHAAVWTITPAELQVSYTRMPGMDTACAVLLTDKGPVRRLVSSLVAVEPKYGFGEYFTTLDHHFGAASDVEDTEECVVSSETGVEGFLELASGESLRATVGVMLPVIYLYFGPHLPGIHRPK